MKTLLIAILLIISTTAYSQDFKTVTYGSAGVNIDAEYNLTQVQGTAELNEQMKIGGTSFSLVALSLFKADVPLFLGGAEVAQEVWNKDNKSLSLTGRYLYGTAGEQYIGLGMNYGISQVVSAKVNGDWDYKGKTALVTMGIGYTIIY